MNSLNKKILIAICSYNSKNYTKRLYEELIQSEQYLDIIIIDNSNKEEEICDFGNVHFIGKENVEFGGMHDYTINLPLIEDYNFVGIFNNDIYGFTQDHFVTLQKYLNRKNGYISFSISSEVDKAVEYSHNGIMKNKQNSVYRTTNFIENVAPIYNLALINELKKYCPIHKFGLIDFFMSRKSNELGLDNIIIDEHYFHHIRSGTRKIVGSLQYYLDNGTLETQRWKSRFPEISKYL